MEHVFDQPAIRHIDSAGTRDLLLDSLDDLLERYMNLVHQYQTLQQTLQKEVSSV